MMEMRKGMRLEEKHNVFMCTRRRFIYMHMNLRLVHMNLRLVHMNTLCFSSNEMDQRVLLSSPCYEMLMAAVWEKSCC